MKNLINKLFVAYYKIPWVKEHWAKRFETIQTDSIPWTPLSKPLRECKIALLTTAGIHLKADTPFNMDDTQGDPSYRKIPSDTSPDQLMITHDYYDHSDANKDINIVLPIDILRECQQAGMVGKSSDFFYSFMGHIAGPHLTTVIKITAIEVAQQLKQEKVDIALLTPA